MNFDDLNKPLGLAKPRSQVAPHAPIPWRGIVVGGALLVAAGSLGYARLGPEGMSILISGKAPAPREVVREIVQAPAQPPASEPAPAVSLSDVTGSTTPATPPPRAQADEIESASGVKVVRQGGGSAPQSLIIAVPAAKPATGLPTAPDPRLVETARAGQLPRIGPDGLKPMEAYARPAPAAGGKPRLAIVIGGMGLNPQVTSEAIERLPEAITLGFAPYGRNLAQQVASARADGHEVILQAPMDGFASESEEPGPNVLRTGAPAPETVGRLHWHMSRFQGYVGLGGYMGARFMADGGSLAPVMAEVAKRGLFYFDDGSAQRSQTSAAGAKAGAPVVRADVAIDARLDDIDGALSRLEQLAKSRGAATGVAVGLPIVVEKTARFARGLEAKGFELTPLSAMARTPEKPAARAPQR